MKCFFRLDGYRYYLSQLSESEKREYLPVKNALELIPDILNRKKLEIVLGRGRWCYEFRFGCKDHQPTLTCLSWICRCCFRFEPEANCLLQISQI